ncbi:MAG: hypothetical protein ACLPN1_09800 [Dissulfurispiraceae bacterium]
MFKKMEIYEAIAASNKQEQMVSDRNYFIIKGISGCGKTQVADQYRNMSGSRESSVYDKEIITPNESSAFTVSQFSRYMDNWLLGVLPKPGERRTH